MLNHAERSSKTFQENKDFKKEVEVKKVPSEVHEQKHEQIDDQATKN